jgi:hypothetical protein
MALIKEDGSIVPGANSYADIADADAFQTDRGRQGWLDADPTVQDAALGRATDYIDGRWELQFAGKPIGDVQDLAYPRKGVRYPATGNPFPEDEVPEDIVTATILYADQVIGDGNTTDYRLATDQEVRREPPGQDPDPGGCASGPDEALGGRPDQQAQDENRERGRRPDRSETGRREQRPRWR